MPLINIVVALIVVGLALWLINNFIPWLPVSRRF